MAFFSQKNSFAAHVFGHSWLIVFLLSSTLCFLVNSYAIDASCRNYQGNDISGDIQQALNEVRDLASNAYDKISHKNPNVTTVGLMQTLFGRSYHRFQTIGYFYLAMSHLSSADEFVVVCGDSMVTLEPDPFLADPRGRWMDHNHAWSLPYERYTPCDPARKPGTSYPLSAFTVLDRLIYLCPQLLNSPRGRILEHYKDQVLAGEWIEDYMLVAPVLLHQILHMNLSFRSLIDQKVKMYPPINVILDPYSDYLITNPAYLDSFPSIPALTFPLCYKLANDHPNRALRNPYTFALFAVGLYLHRNEWGRLDFPGIGAPMVP